MLRSSVHDGLKHIYRLQSRYRPRCIPPRISSTPSCRYLRAGSTDRTSEKEKKKQHKQHASDVTILPGAEFHGFPHLEKARLEREKSWNNDNEGTAPINTGQEASVAHDVRPSTIEKRLDSSDSSRGASVSIQPHNASDNPDHEQSQARLGHSSNSANTHRQEVSGKDIAVPRSHLMRSLRRLKRFRPLLEEARRVGADSPLGHVDSSTGKPMKTLERSVLSTEVLEAELDWVARNTPAPRAVYNILEILICQRKIKPRSNHYEALILGQCHPEFGSIQNVRTILEEIDREDVPMEPPILLAALTVLAVHPDTLLHREILDRLAIQQFTLPESYTHLHILALIRQDQLEMATVELERLSQRHLANPIPMWLWTIYIHAICDLRQDFDALLQLLYRLSDSGVMFPRPTLLHLLEKASKAKDLYVTKFVWHGYVEDMHIVPDEDLCMSALRVAAERKDLKLADSVRVVLESVAGNVVTDPPRLEHQNHLRGRSESLGDDIDIFEDEVDEVEPHSSHRKGLRKSNSGNVSDREQIDMAINTDTVPSREAEVDAIDASDHGRLDKTTSEASATPASATFEPFKLSTIDPMYTDPDVAASTTSRTLPDPFAPPPPPRQLPAEAQTILTSLGIPFYDIEVGRWTGKLGGTHWQETKSQSGRGPRRARGRRTRGILYPLFRPEAGLAGARFDPRLALMGGGDWRNRK